MNIIHIKSVFIVMALLLTFSTVYMNSHTTTWEQHELQLEKLQEIRVLDALSNQELLKVRYQLYYDYDFLTEYTSKLNLAAKKLEENTQPQSEYNKDTLPNRNFLINQLKIKQHLIEQFKETNTSLKSSLLIFPKIAEDTQYRLATTDANKTIYNYIESLGKDILLYSLISDDQLGKKIQRRINATRNWQIDNSKGLAKIFKKTIQQAQFIIDKRRQLNNIIINVMSMPIAELTKELQNAYLSRHQIDVERSNQYQTILYILSIILLAYTAYILIKFKRKAAELAQEKDRALVTLRSIGDGVIATNANSIVQFINPVAEKLTGYLNKDAKGKHLHKLFNIMDENTNEPITGLIERCIIEQQRIGATEKSVLINKNNESIPIEECVAPIKGADNETIGAIIVFRDVSRTRELARKLVYQANHDSLTGVINRRAFDSKLSQVINNAKKQSIEHALLYLDLDQFKIINDTCGHDAGDQLLIQITSLLSKSLNNTDTLARLGGDEFGVLLENCTLDRAKIFANDVVNDIKHFKFSWHGIGFQLGVSIGIAFIDQSSESAVNILSAADMACYLAKDTGRNRFHVFNTSDTELMQRHGEMQWVSRLMQAFKDGDFVLFRQPVVPISPINDNLKHYELLIRLKHGKNKYILPNTFIPAAERYNIMPILDRWVIRTAFKQCFEYDHDACYAINLSGTSLNSDTLLTYIKNELKIFSIPTEQVCFEITETAAIENLNNAAKLIAELKTLGFKFALDDFGKGLSSYTYLSTLPVDYLKIDGEFVANIDNNPVYREIIKSVNHIGHLMGMQTIAECVEDHKTYAYLKSLGVDYVQGFAFGKPELFDLNWSSSPQKTAALPT